MNRTPEVGAEMLALMLDTLDFPVYAFDKERCIVFANKASGLSPGTRIGAGEENHLTNNHYYDEDGNLLPYPRGSAVDRALSGEETHDLVLEHRNVKDRTHAWISVSCVPVMHEDGSFNYAILWYRDISKKKKREDKLRFLLSAMRVLTITTDFERRLKEKAALTIPGLADWCAIEIVNPEGALVRVALVHRDPKKIEWIKDYERTYPNPTGVERAAERVVRTGKAEFTPRITREMVDSAPGLTEEQKQDIHTLNLASIMTLPIGNPGKVLGALTLAYAESGRTYTEEDRDFFQEFAHHLGVLLENARLYNEINQRDLYKDMFLASLSHELRNPLAPIKTSLELLKLRADLDRDLSAELTVIEHQFDHMARLLNDLLDTTRFVRGKIRVETEPVDLRPVIEHVIKAAQNIAEAGEIALTYALPSEAVVAEADRTRIEQAVTNLINNAIKFTPRGGRVTVTLTATDEAAVLSVKDTGAGLTDEERKHIFEPYYQSERVKAGNSGLGLGLRFVHEITQLHGGTIEATSEGSDLGSEFVLTLPLSSEAKKETPSMEQSPTGPKQILIIDDNQAAADALVRLFTALGYTAMAHYSAKDAFVHMDETPVDIIFADIGMPEMNGYEFVKTLRENGYTKMPVVALTGYGLEEDREKALAAGFNEHLTKPVGAEELKRVITELTRG